MLSLRHMQANVDFIKGDMKKSHNFKNQIVILLMARSSLIFFSRILCVFKVKTLSKTLVLRFSGWLK